MKTTLKRSLMEGALVNFRGRDMGGRVSEAEEEGGGGRQGWLLLFPVVLLHK